MLSWRSPGVEHGGPGARRTALRAAQAGLQLVGADALFARTSAGGAMILMYHAVVDERAAPWVDPRVAMSASVFAAQMRFLARHRRVIALDELVERVAARRELAPGTVVITFDDGYRGVLEHAAPVLARHGLPAVAYLATGALSRGGEPQYVDALWAAFNTRTRDRLDLAEHGLGVRDLRRAPAVRATFLALDRHLLAAGDAERRRILAEVERQLRPESRPPRLTLTWREAARLREVHPGIELGVHTRDHVDLSARPTAEVARQVEGSVEDAARALGRPPRHFSFPFGRASAEARGVVVAAGLRSAAVTEPAALVRAGCDPYALPRLSAPADMRLFPFFTSGAYPDLSLRLLGRA